MELNYFNALSNQCNQLFKAYDNDTVKANKEFYVGEMLSIFCDMNLFLLNCKNQRATVIGTIMQVKHEIEKRTM